MDKEYPLFLPKIMLKDFTIFVKIEYLKYNQKIIIIKEDFLKLTQINEIN